MIVGRAIGCAMDRKRATGVLGIRIWRGAISGATINSARVRVEHLAVVRHWLVAIDEWVRRWRAMADALGRRWPATMIDVVRRTGLMVGIGPARAGRRSPIVDRCPAVGLIPTSAADHKVSPAVRQVFATDFVTTIDTVPTATDIGAMADRNRDFADRSRPALLLPIVVSVRRVTIDINPRPLADRDGAMPNVVARLEQIESRLDALIREISDRRPAPRR